MTARSLGLALALLAGAALAAPTATDIEMSDASAAPPSSGPASAMAQMRAARLAFADLAGWADDDHAAAFAAFRESCRAILAAAPELRPGMAPSPGLVAACRAARSVSPADARAFFEARFAPWRIQSADGGDAFFTG